MSFISNNGSVYILSLDAKDIWLSNHYIKSDNRKGYNIRDQNGDIKLGRFINVLDYSLDLIKLREVYEKVYRRTNFSFIQDGKEYTQRVINVTFKYSVKEFNKAYKNIYIKNGYSPSDISFVDCVCIENNELIAIKTNTPIKQPISDSMLGKYFYFEDGMYKVKTNIKTSIGVSNLRTLLYKDGFYCDGIKYIRFKRSAGSSRVGKCLFIDEKLYNRMHKWEMCGIKVKDGQSVDLAALEAYIALPLSSIIGTVEINPENILLIDDYNSEFEDEVISVDEKEGQLHAQRQRITIKNSIWDGQSLIDPSLMGEFSQWGFILLRNRFFKSACFNCNIQEWFKDNGIKSISQLNGFTVAKSIDEIKLITTPSSIKYLKFGDFSGWLKQLDPMFGVVKHEKPTHFFDGRMVQIHYQLLNSLGLSQEEVDDLVSPSLEYLNAIRNNPSVLQYHIKYPTEYDFEWTAANSKNDVVYKFLGLNSDFSKTKLYSDFKNDIVRSFIRNLRQGHILVNGTYATMIGNPIEMLKQSINQFDGVSQIGIGNIHTLRFPYDSTILGSRSPHVASGNVLITKNQRNAIIDRYINLTNEIVCVNSIGENLLNRLSGSDFDSDTLLLTDNPLLIQAAQRHYKDFLVPTNLVPGIKKKRKYTSNEKADLDIKTSVNKIGQDINLAQELNTLLWDRYNNGTPIDQLFELYCDIAKLDVLSNIEIDKAKKEYVIDTANEIKIIKEKYNLLDTDGKQIKPNFFGAVAKTKGYYNPNRKNYKFHCSSMDFLQHSINKIVRGTKVTKFMSFSDLLEPFDFDYNKVFFVQVSRILDLIKDTKTRISKVYKDLVDIDAVEKHRIAFEIRQKCVEYIDKIRLNSHTMYWLLRMIESEECKDIRRLMFSILFGTPNQSFFALIKQSRKPVKKLIEDKDGEIHLYDFNFKLVN